MISTHWLVVPPANSVPRYSLAFPCVAFDPPIDWHNGREVTAAVFISEVMTSQYPLILHNLLQPHVVF